jgi:hypothetical protein
MADNYPPPTPPMPPQPPAMQPPPPPAAQVQPLPWEQPGYPALEALYETAKLFLTAPSQAFARMSLTGTLGRPVLYAVIFGWLGIVASQAYSLAFRGAIHNLLSGLPGYNPRMMFGLPVVGTVAVMFFAPILVLLGILIWSAIVHLFLMLVGGANTGFGSTVRVVAYSSTVQIVQVIPLCGGTIAAIWALVLYIIGLAIAHRTTQGRSALAVLLPLMLCCVCVAILVAAFGAAIAAALGHLGR